MLRAIGAGFRQSIDYTLPLDAPAQALDRERGSGAVAQQSLEPGSVIGLDGHARIARLARSRTNARLGLYLCILFRHALCGADVGRGELISKLAVSAFSIRRVHAKGSPHRPVRHLSASVVYRENSHCLSLASNFYLTKGFEIRLFQQ